MDLSYAAGIIDGEGYIGINKIVAKSTYSIRVDVGMSDKGKPILLALQQAYGGKVDQTQPTREKWRAEMSWRLNGVYAAEFLRMVRPFLILKREQADLAIQLQEFIEAGRREIGRHHWTPERLRRAEIMKQRMHDLNRRGPDPEVRTLPTRTPVAIWRWGAFWEPQDSLFGPVEFEGNLPPCGAMIGGHVYALNASAPTPSSPGLLLTPRASDTGSPGRRASEGFRPPLSEVVFDLTA